MMWRSAAVAGLVSVLIVSLAPPGTLGDDDGEAGERPYMVQRDWEGFLSCRASTPLVGVSCGGLDPNDEYAHAFNVSEGVETIVVALVWESGPVLGADGLQLFLIEQGEEYDALGHAAGGSPVEFRVDAGEDFDPVDGVLDLHFRVFPTYEPQVIYQQSFAVHYHSFYGAPAPQGYSAIPGK